MQQYVTPGNPACYISDVTYGRVFYLLVESTSASSSITSSINASFSGVANGPSANINASYLSNLQNLNIKLFALGGDASTTLYETPIVDQVCKLLEDSILTLTRALVPSWGVNIRTL